ncbi:MAG: GNAT family N-acetyltransferase [Rhodanobacter sp.]
MIVRDAKPADFPAILALNQTWVAVLSPLDAARLAQLHAQAALHRVIEHDGSIVAFMLAFRERADYDGGNFQWFTQRYERFLYIDRIVVAGSEQARGLGSLLYRDAIGVAMRERVPYLACEIDIEPPNTTSRRFHERLAFQEVGQRRLDGGKTVAMQVLEIPAGGTSDAVAGRA